MEIFNFSAEVFIIGVNPYVYLPDTVLSSIFKQSGKDKGAIPVKGKINGKDFVQTLVKYQGFWRLYINGIVRKVTGVDVGSKVKVEISYDNSPRIEPMHKMFKTALEKNERAKEAFGNFPPSRQKEINRYINFIKTEETRSKVVDKIIRHLNGEKVDYFVLLRNKK